MIMAAAVVFAIAAVSCSKMEQSSVTTEPSTDGFTAVMEEAGTKTSLNEAFTALNWCANDAIVISDGTNTGTYKTAAGDGNFTFDSGTAITAGESKPLFAAYPSTAAISFGGKSCTTTIPTTQNYTAGSFDNGSFPMVSYVAGGNSFSFKNAAGILRIDLRGADGVKLESLTLTADKAVAGPVTVAWNDGTPTTTLASEGTSQSITLDFGDGFTPTSTVAPFFVAVAPNKASETYTFSISVKVDGVVDPVVIGGISATTITRSAITTISVSSNQFYKDIAVLNCKAAGLTAAQKEYANCYVVNEAGTYQFKATVKGNGVKTDGTADAAIAPKSAKVINTTLNTSATCDDETVIKGVTLMSNGYVKFSTPATLVPGNAVIAVYDNEDPAAEGAKILWSWQIWVTPNAKLDEYHIYPSGAKFMTLNLGAISNTRGSVEALGTYYQWGRKDPFVGPNDIASTTYAVQTATFTCGNSMTVTEGVENPLKFIKATAGFSDTNANLWNSTDNKKTEYDPCPVGYRVPKHTNTSAKSGADAYALNDFHDLVSKAYDTTNKGHMLGAIKDKNNEEITDGVWFPFGGILSCSGNGALCYVGTQGGYLSRVFSTSANMYRLHLSGATVYADGSGQWSSDYRGHAQSVRCVREN